jgi:pyruvate kinase
VCILTLCLQATLIVTLTETGLTTRLVCKYRPPIPVIAITSWQHTVKVLMATRATVPMLVQSLSGTDELVGKALDMVSQLFSFVILCG